DVERIQHVGVEQEVVGPGAGLFTRDHVHDQVDLVRVARLVAAEHEEVGDVSRGVERDERRFAVTGGAGGLRRGGWHRQRRGERRNGDAADGAWESHGSPPPQFRVEEAYSRSPSPAERASERGYEAMPRVDERPPESQRAELTITLGQASFTHPEQRTGA